MATRYISPTLALSAVVVILALMVSPVFADGVYHSQHIALAPVGDFPLRSGFVENIHSNGPINFAHENYVLNGAAPDTSFGVYLLVHLDSECAVPIAEFDTATLTTNVAGNGKAQRVFTPEEAPHDMTIYGLWELRVGGVVAYTTDCSMIELD